MRSISKKFKIDIFNPKYEIVPYASTLFEDEVLLDTVSGIEAYLLGTGIVDMKTNDGTKQNDLENNMLPNERNWIKYYSKLRGNNLTNISLNLFNIEHSLKVNELVKEVNYNELIKDYNDKSFQRKIETVSKLDENLFEFLEQMYNEYY